MVHKYVDLVQSIPSLSELNRERYNLKLQTSTKPNAQVSAPLLSIEPDQIKISATDFPLCLSKIDYAPPEIALANHFIAIGYQSFKTENHYWWALQNLFFYEEIYSEMPPFTFPGFQTINGIPADFFQGEGFYTRRKEILQRKNILLLETDLQQDIVSRIDKFSQNKMAHFIRDKVSPQGLELMCKIIPRKAIISILDRINSNIVEMRIGLPDLFVYKTDPPEFFFVEVKQPREKVSIGQEHWIKFFNESGAPTKLYRVNINKE